MGSRSEGPAPRPWRPWREGALPRDYAGDPAWGPAVTSGYLADVSRTWQNGWFAVLAREVETEWGAVTHVMIRNAPNTPVRCWPDLMRIKDALFGRDRTAVEVYPPRSEVIDQANMTHLWVLPAGMQLPFSLAPREESVHG